MTGTTIDTIYLDFEKGIRTSRLDTEIKKSHGTENLNQLDRANSSGTSGQGKRELIVHQ